MLNKYIRLSLVFLIFIFGFASVSYAQLSPAEIAKAKELLNSQDKQNPQMTVQPPTVQKEKSPPSDIENFFNDSILAQPTSEGIKPIKQFGYDFFSKAPPQALAVSAAAVDPSYLVGPGDAFAITLWGITEGIYSASVNSEGEIILPKIGAVNVAGLKYSELKPFIEKELSRYFEKVNVDVSMTSIKNIWVYVVGEVENPGSYNVSSLSTVYHALYAAGGPSQKGSLRNIKLIRNGQTIGHLDFYDFLMQGDKNQDRVLQDGDTILVPLIGPTVGIVGNVYRPAIYEIKGSADLSDLLRICGGLLPTGNSSRVQIDRIVAHTNKIILDKKLKYSKYIPKLYVSLENMDLIRVYPIYAEITNVVYLEGSVKYPGPYEFKSEMRLKDLIPGKEALKFGTYLPNAEIVRVNKINFETEIIEIDLKKLFAGDQKENQLLQFGDRIVISSELKTQSKILLSGEFVAPGAYYIQKGERLSSLIKRAGGFTPEAYLFGAVFTRKSAAEAQTASISTLISKMDKDIIVREQELALGVLDEGTKAAKMESLNKNKELIKNLKQSFAGIQGRVIIHLNNNSSDFRNNDYDITLEDGDRLKVSAIPNVVNVIGEVYTPSSVVYNEGEQTSYYLAKVGGPTKDADRDSIYVIRADGSVLSRFQGAGVLSAKLYPGDSILVPTQLDKFNFWGAVKDFTQWLYQITLSVAVVITALK